MNYRLSVYANRVTGKNCFTLECRSKLLKSRVTRFYGDNIKENALDALYQGLKASRSVLKHDDVVLIEIQNQHLNDWLSGFKEYPLYTDGLDRVFDVLENIDCKYRFLFTKEPYAKVYGGKHDITQIMGYTGVSAMLEEFGN